MKFGHFFLASKNSGIVSFSRRILCTGVIRAMLSAGGNVPSLNWSLFTDVEPKKLKRIF